MRVRHTSRALALAALLALCAAASDHPVAPIGTPAPDFHLPGVDGKMHSLADYAGNKLLAIVFTCNHCPIAQIYEQRIAKLAADYGPRGVAVVAVQPNAPEAIRLDELDCSDVSDSPAEMKIRARYKRITYPYLYDGAEQQLARALGPQATPHVFVFDQQRKLRYEGRVDDSYRPEKVKSEDARNAIEVLLAGRDVAVAHTGVFGCSTKWKEKEASRLAALRKIESLPVTLNPVSADELKTLRANAGDKFTLIAFWSKECETCVQQLEGFETTRRMYGPRSFDVVTVAAGKPEEHARLQAALARIHAAGRNLFIDEKEATAVSEVFGGQWTAGAPYAVLLAPGGEVLFSKAGSVDMLALRRTILSRLPGEYAGFNRYWMAKQ